MNNSYFIAFLACVMFADAKAEVHYLNPDFKGMDKVEFMLDDDGHGKILRGRLEGKNGRKYEIPDICEPEGGDAQLADAYTVQGKRNYFLFTCAWLVQHSGIGINGAQYETFVYEDSGSNSIAKNDALSQSLSGYEGSLEGGAMSYAWYVQRKIASEKLLELEAGVSKDSLGLAHNIVLALLEREDYNAVANYLSRARVEQLFRDFPVDRFNVVAFNDFGYALGLSNEDQLAYEVLARVEIFDPDRIVLKLNIADVLWGVDREKARRYYLGYIKLMQENRKASLIPERVLKRVNSE